MPDANPINPIYTYQNAYHSQGQNGTFSRTIRVTATTNNPLRLTGSFAGNAGFIVMNPEATVISASNGQGYTAADFSKANQDHLVYPIQLSYVSASAAGDVTVVYY